MKALSLALLLALCATAVARSGVETSRPISEWKPLKLVYAPKRPHFDWLESGKLSAAINTLQDVGQTNQFSAFGFKELNFLVKRLVDTKQLWAYNVVTGVALFGVWRLVESIPDKKVRAGVYWAWAIIEGLMVWHNRKAVGASGFPIIIPVFKF